MCGIAGSIGKTLPEPDRLAAAAISLRHRGPDSNGVWSGDLGGQRVALVHTRLSIIDLDPRANQPFEGDDCVLTYNGELYNYLELRKELQSLGHGFRTESDTEVVVRAWRQWGIESFDRFEGMWAFALADTQTGQVVLSRDRFGEKPLYLWKCGGKLLFGSEVKALAALAGRWPGFDEAQVRRFLVNGYKSLYKQPGTFYEGVLELPAGSVQIIEAGTSKPLSGPEQAKRYWSLSYAPRPMTEAEMIEGVRERLRRAVELRLRADVPLAFCVSGGIDSGALASFASKELGCDVHAFSIIDGDERYDETRNIRATTEDLGCTLHTVRTQTGGFLDRLKKQTAERDAPVATISYYVHNFLSEAIAGAGYRIAVSGTGADELFTGYYDHYAFWLAEMSGRSDAGALVEDWRCSYGAWVQNPVLQDPMVFRDRPDERGHMYLDRAVFNAFLEVPCEEVFHEAAFCENKLRNRMMNELFAEAVPVILREDDLNSMQWSVENRSPYLDRELVEFAYSIPNELLINDGCVKWPLRAASQGILNDQVRLEKRKRGFNASIDSLLNRDDPQVVEQLLAPGPVFDIIRRDAVERFLRGDLYENSFSKFAFSFVATKLFLEADRSVTTLTAAA
jgi:asparagine synthase (glutamine-hydrolysing)